MALTKRYYTVNGRLVGERDKSVPVGRVDYLTDALGSVTATVDQNAAVENTYRYKPYGAQLAKTGGSTDPKFLFVGAPGYRQTSIKHSENYVRARHRSSRAGSWTTKDRIDALRFTVPYVYVNQNPATLTDPTGEWPRPINCPEHFIRKVDRICLYLYMMPNQDQYLINECIRKASNKIGISCYIITESRKKCIERWCKTEGVYECKPLGGPYGRCPKFEEHPWPWVSREDPWDEIEIDLSHDEYKGSYAAAWLHGQWGQLVFLHELMHACGQAHNNSDKKRECNDIQACCILEILINGNDGRRCVSDI